MSHRRLRPTFTGHFLLAVLAVGLLAAISPADEKKESPADATPAPVSLTIDFGDGFQKRYVQIPFRAGMTVADVMEHAEKHAKPTHFTVRSKGSTALVTKIDDQDNQGGKGLNWLFEVNERLGDRSFGVTTLEQGDAVLWKFDEYR